MLASYTNLFYGKNLIPKVYPLPTSLLIVELWLSIMPEHTASMKKVLLDSFLTKCNYRGS